MFKGKGGMGGIASMMQKAQKIQENVKTAQHEIKNLEVLGHSANQIKVRMTGDYKLQDIEIPDNILVDKQLLSKNIIQAINDATSQIQDFSKEKMQEATGGINLPF